MENQISDQGKTVAVISYITLIGWVIALIMNNGEKTALGSFHIRQMLGIMLLGLALTVVINILGIPVLGWILNLGVLVLWILGLISAIQGEMKPIPVLGLQFQEWFKGIG
jgi:uncharacterized membrane protein